MILIVSFPANEHVDEVRSHLRLPSVVVNTASFPASIGVIADLENQKETVLFRIHETGESICLRKIGAVWYHRIKPYGFHPDLKDSTSRLFAWSEANEALMGVWYTLNCFWMNPPLADELAQRKIKQLQVARNIGLSIPDTLITNEPTAAMEFIERNGVENVVRKAFRNIMEAPRETYRLKSTDITLIDSVRYTPVIFQRFVPASLDLRVTIVEDDLFAAAIKSEVQYEADYRIGLKTAQIIPYSLPSDVSDKLMKLLKVLGLKYGAIDLRVTPDGEHVFLEVNPAGEFIFISRRTNQPIAEAIAACLERHDIEAEVDSLGC